MRTIGLIRQDNKNNMVYETQNLLQCMFLSFARVVCTHCKNIERKQYFVARADRFARRWTFRTAVTVSGGGDFLHCCIARGDGRFTCKRTKCPFWYATI